MPSIDVDDLDVLLTSEPTRSSATLRDSHDAVGTWIEIFDHLRHQPHRNRRNPRDSLDRCCVRSRQAAEAPDKRQDAGCRAQDRGSGRSFAPCSASGASSSAPRASGPRRGPSRTSARKEVRQHEIDRYPALSPAARLSMDRSAQTACRGRRWPTALLTCSSFLYDASVARVAPNAARMRRTMRRLCGPDRPTPNATRKAARAVAPAPTNRMSHPFRPAR